MSDDKKTAAELLRQKRAAEGRTLHEHRPFHLVGVDLEQAQIRYEAALAAARHEGELQRRIDKVLAMHVPTDVFDPQEGEDITICDACQEITGGDDCTTTRILKGEDVD